MKFIVEIDDFWLDECEELEPALKGYIISDCVRQISEKIEHKIKTQVLEEIKSLVNNILTKEVNSKVKTYIAEGKVRGRYSDDELTIEEAIKEMFEKDTGYSSMREQILSVAKKLSSEMKNRYDLLFASQFVAKMNEQGMLKEDVARLLLPSADSGADKKQ